MFHKRRRLTPPPTSESIKSRASPAAAVSLHILNTFPGFVSLIPPPKRRLCSIVSHQGQTNRTFLAITNTVNLISSTLSIIVLSVITVVQLVLM